MGVAVVGKMALTGRVLGISGACKYASALSLPHCYFLHLGTLIRLVSVWVFWCDRQLLKSLEFFWSVKAP